MSYEDLEPLGTDNIRDLLSPIIGQTILEVTSDDWNEVCERYPDPEDRTSCIYLHLSNGETMAIKVLGGTGFAYPVEPGIDL